MLTASKINSLGAAEFVRPAATAMGRQSPGRTAGYVGIVGGCGHSAGYARIQVRFGDGRTANHAEIHGGSLGRTKSYAGIHGGRGGGRTLIRLGPKAFTFHP